MPHKHRIIIIQHNNIGGRTLFYPDDRLSRIGELLQPDKLTPAHVDFVDIAGLVRGASEGEGLGNQLDLELVFVPRRSREKAAEAIKSGTFFRRPEISPDDTE